MFRVPIYGQDRHSEGIHLNLQMQAALSGWVLMMANIRFQSHGSLDQILNSKKFGDIKLNSLEAAAHNNILRNAVGYNVDLTTLTGIAKEITKQTFYQIAPSQYMPVAVGENPYAEEILTYRTFLIWTVDGAMVHYTGNIVDLTIQLGQKTAVQNELVVANISHML